MRCRCVAPWNDCALREAYQARRGFHYLAFVEMKRSLLRHLCWYGGRVVSWHEIALRDAEIHGRALRGSLIISALLFRKSAYVLRASRVPARNSASRG